MSASALLPSQCRNQRKKKALADAKHQFARVADENRALARALEDTQQENYEVTEHLRLELLEKTQKIGELQAQLAKVTLHDMTCGLHGGTCGTAGEESGCLPVEPYAYQIPLTGS
jgi:hypothetical protein